MFRIVSGYLELNGEQVAKLTIPEFRGVEIMDAIGLHYEDVDDMIEKAETKAKIKGFKGGIEIFSHELKADLDVAYDLYEANEEFTKKEKRVFDHVTIDTFKIMTDLENKLEKDAENRV